MFDEINHEIWSDFVRDVYMETAKLAIHGYAWLSSKFIKHVCSKTSSNKKVNIALGICMNSKFHQLVKVENLLLPNKSITIWRLFISSR